jgi:hypothetical protein
VIVSTASCLHALAAETHGDTDDMVVRCLGFFMFCMLVYYIPYQGISYHGALTGLAIGLLLHRARPREFGGRRLSIVHRDAVSHMS